MSPEPFSRFQSRSTIKGRLWENTAPQIGGPMASCWTMDNSARLITALPAVNTPYLLLRALTTGVILSVRSLIPVHFVAFWTTRMALSSLISPARVIPNRALSTTLETLWALTTTSTSSHMDFCALAHVRRGGAVDHHAILADVRVVGLPGGAGQADRRAPRGGCRLAAIGVA